MREFDYNIAGNPEIFEQNRLPAHSDHLFLLPDAQGELIDGRVFLNGQWKFSYAENYEKAVPGFYKEDFDCSSWDEIRVPAHIQTEGYDIPQYVNTQYPWDGSEELLPGEIPVRFNPTASYIRTFALPPHMRGRRVFISFQGVESGFALWLNGKYVGYSEDSFTPADFELTDLVREENNVLAVQVFKWTSGSWCEDQDFFRFSGIFRDVFLYTVPDVHVRDMRVRTLLDDEYRDADLVLDFSVWGEGSVRVKLAGQGRTVFEEAADLSEGTSLRYHVAEPKLWSAEAPFLYDLTLEISDRNGCVQEMICEKVGFRRFEIRDSIMLLNGKRIVFKGVNRHEFTCDTGRVMDEDTIRFDLTVMKQNNINAIRTCHYPNNSALYRLCDEFGLYVIDETNMETHGIWDAIYRAGKDISFAVPGDRPEFLQMVLDRGNSMYQRDKNHACILIWSCGNESFGGRDIYEMSLQFHRLDDTRPVHYEGIFHDRRYPKTSDMESQMYPTVAAIREFLAEHRDKPFICCEYSHAMGNSCGALHKYTSLAYEDELYQGGFIWDYIDQSMTLTDRYGNLYQGYGGDFGDRPCDYNFSGNGIVYGDDRLPSPKMQEVKFCYQNIEVGFDGDDCVVVNRNLFVNTDIYDCVITLSRNGEEIARRVCTVSTDPLSESRFDPGIAIPEEASEYCITVSFVLREDTVWAKAGHEIAFGQKVIEKCEAAAEDGTASFMKAEPASDERKPLTVIYGWANTGVRGEKFEALFSAFSGGLVSYKYEGRQLLQGIPKPNFWRAPTDNDTANLLAERAGQWKAASLYSTIRENHGYGGAPYEVTETEDSVRIAYTYHLPVQPKKDCRLIYEVYGDGTIRVNLSMEKTSDVGELPEFSVLFLMDPEFERMRWYGLGPDDTYADRCSGGKLGIYETLVSDNMAKYLVPQECGNKMDVRWASVTDKDGHGLLFTSDRLQFSALPWTPQEVENAAHPNELPPVHHTCIRIGRQMGVGGDDTWGALVHEEYLLDNSEEMEICFEFRGL